MLRCRIHDTSHDLVVVSSSPTPKPSTKACLETTQQMLGCYHHTRDARMQKAPKARPKKGAGACAHQGRSPLMHTCPTCCTCHLGGIGPLVGPWPMGHARVGSTARHADCRLRVRQKDCFHPWHPSGASVTWRAWRGARCRIPRAPGVASMPSLMSVPLALEGHVRGSLSSIG